MAATLQEILLAPDARPEVIADCYSLLERQVAAQPGVSGTSIRLACKTVNTFRPGHIRHMVGALLPQLVDKLEPYWADYVAGGGSVFADYLTGRAAEVAQDLLAVADARAAASGRPTVVRAYGTVRGSAARHIEAALPQVGDLVVKYAS